MADNDEYNDEYQLADPDATGSDSMENDLGLGDESKQTKAASADNAKNIRRNALIVVGVFILVLVLYKVLGAIFSTKEQVIKTSVTTVSAPTQPSTEPTYTPPLPQTSMSDLSGTTGVSNANRQVERQLSAVETSQQTMQTEFVAMSNQLSGMNNNVNAILAKMAELNKIIDTLHTQVAMQSHEIDRLTTQAQQRKQMKPIKHMKASGVNGAISIPKYYLQAVIPGRAWLIATNGTTLTVREGTLIQGYGMVKLIDPSQGRVLTSAGQVIRFSQDDS